MDLSIINSDLFIKIFRYSVVGLINWLIFIIILTGFAALGMNYIIYSAIAYLISCFFSFFFNLYYTFRVSGNIRKRFSVFMIISVLNTLIVELIQIFLVEYLNLSVLIGIICGMIFFSTFGFIMNHRYVYPKID